MAKKKRSKGVEKDELRPKEDVRITDKDKGFKDVLKRIVDKEWKND